MRGEGLGKSLASRRGDPQMPKPTKLHRIPPAILQRSRDFRHPLTPTEAKVWQAVRRRQLGVKVRRQHPIDRFIADFYVAEAKLVVEIDGDSHAPPDLPLHPPPSSAQSTLSLERAILRRGSSRAFKRGSYHPGPPRHAAGPLRPLDPDRLSALGGACVTVPHRERGRGPRTWSLSSRRARWGAAPELASDPSRGAPGTGGPPGVQSGPRRRRGSQYLLLVGAGEKCRMVRGEQVSP